MDANGEGRFPEGSKRLAAGVWSRLIRLLMLGSLVLASLALADAEAAGSGTWSPPQVLATFDAAFTPYPGNSLAVDAAGKWHAAFVDRTIEGEKITTYIKHLEPGGATEEIARESGTQTGPSIGGPCMAVDASGTMHLLYSRWGGSLGRAFPIADLYHEGR